MTKNAHQQTLKTQTHLERKHVLMYSLIFITAPILTFLIGRLIDNTLSLPKFPPFPLNLVIGFTVFFTGLATGIKSTRLLLKKGQGLPWGEFNGQSQTTKLVTDGLYAYCRNPMTLGYSLLPCGMGIMFQSIGMTFFIPAITLLIAVAWVRTREEPRLKKRFGETYLEYKRKTPFLIPHAKPLISDFINFMLRLPQDQENKELRRLILLQFAFTSISLLSLFLLAILTFNTTILMIHSQKQLTGSLFSVICLMGIAAGISPSRCSGILHYKRTRNNNSNKTDEKNTHRTRTTFKGHHPTCGNFSAHIFQLGSKTYCAGCAGLVTGATIALMGSLLYFFAGMGIGTASIFIFWSGFALVILGLLQYTLFMNKASIHFFLNAIFVIGAFLLLVGVNEINGTFTLQLYLLVLILYWIMTRTTLSRFEHEKKCAICDSKPCIVFSD